MQVDINGLRINLAQSFNRLVDESMELEKLSSDQKEALQELRQNIAFLLLVYDKSIKMYELDPDEYLREIPND